MRESESESANSETAQEQDKNQTSIGRMQSDSRSEAGIKKILTVLKVSNTISSSGIAVRTLTTAQSERTRKAREANRGKRNSIPKGVYKPFGR